MEPKVRIFKNSSDKEVFDAQIGVTIPAGGRVSISTAYHMPPSRPEIVDITDNPDEHTQEALPTETVAQAQPQAAQAQEGTPNAQ